MSHTHRAQILMDPQEFQTLTRIAAQRGVSVAELVRLAVRREYFRSGDEKLAAVQSLAALSLPVGDWAAMKGEIEDAYDAGLP